MSAKSTFRLISRLLLFVWLFTISLVWLVNPQTYKLVLFTLFMSTILATATSMLVFSRVPTQPQPAQNQQPQLQQPQLSQQCYYQAPPKNMEPMNEADPKFDNVSDALADQVFSDDSSDESDFGDWSSDEEPDLKGYDCRTYLMYSKHLSRFKAAKLWKYTSCYYNKEHTVRDLLNVIRRQHNLTEELTVESRCIEQHPSELLADLEPSTLFVRPTYEPQKRADKKEADGALKLKYELLANLQYSPQISTFKSKKLWKTSLLNYQKSLTVQGLINSVRKANCIDEDLTVECHETELPPSDLLSDWEPSLLKIKPKSRATSWLELSALKRQSRRAWQQASATLRKWKLPAAIACVIVALVIASMVGLKGAELRPVSIDNSNTQHATIRFMSTRISNYFTDNLQTPITVSYSKEAKAIDIIDFLRTEKNITDDIKLCCGQCWTILRPSDLLLNGKCDEISVYKRAF